jgi:hypothetical protein
MISSLKLPLGVDPQLLRPDLDQVNSQDWIRHFNTRYFEGQWTGAVLRAAVWRARRQRRGRGPPATPAAAGEDLVQRAPGYPEFTRPLRDVTSASRPGSDVSYLFGRQPGLRVLLPREAPWSMPTSSLPVCDVVGLRAVL